MGNIVIYSATVNNRLRYVLDWLVKERLQLDYTLVNDEKDIPASGFFISYGRQFNHALSIPDAGLLTETGIKEHAIPTSSWGALPVLYAAGNGGYTIPFDLFSALFFLLSRYEEYYPYTPDKHGRYPATNSLLFKNNWLQRPIADEWVQELRELLVDQYHLDIPAANFVFQPSYDIDIAYSYYCKGWQRNAGGYLTDALKGNIYSLVERTEVLFQHKKDPYDSFSWLRELHREHAWKPVFFVLAALTPTNYDKNIPPYQPEMKKLIKQLAMDGIVGVHPSYYADTHEVLVKEKRLLEKITKKDIHFSRQHYIKFTIPNTYYFLMKIGIEHECSMGYGSHIGFRAGTGESFLWYDIKNEAVAPLRIHPFCFMDTTAHYQERLRPAEAFALLKDVTARLKKVNSRLVTIFHNFSLGHDREWKGWSDAYRQFLKEM